MEKAELYLLVVLILGLIPACPCVSPAAPITRAYLTLEGLFNYFTQTERGGKPQPKPSHCPCFTCPGKNCTPPICTWCSRLQDNACPKKSSPGCYTTGKAACVCNDPPGPIPSGANTAATDFFFACGQIGGLAPWGTSASYSQCLCESDWLYSCTNCYRWWSAIALEASVNYCLAAGHSTLSPKVCQRVLTSANSMWIHSPYNAHWNAEQRPVFVDDFAWYSLAFLRVFEWTGEAAWLERAAALQDWAWEYGWDKRPTTQDTSEDCGGFWWNLLSDRHYKDSISIVEVLHGAAKLASLKAVPKTNRSRYLDNAETIWKWIFSFDDGRGLLAPNGVMSTGATPEWCCSPLSSANNTNFTNPGPACSNSRIPGMSYNHGLLMSSAALLYNLTGNKTYLMTGLELLDSAVANLTNSDGAVQDVQRGSRFSTAYECSSNSDPGSDFFSFKGIFAAHLAYFAKVLEASRSFSSDTQSKLLSIVKLSSDSAWTKSAAWPPFKKINDVCRKYYADDVILKRAEIPNTNLSLFPKFHWWWSENNASIETPPDTRIWFTNGGIRCTYATPVANNTNNTSHILMWSGHVKGADECRFKCSGNASCVKYIWYDDSKAGPRCPCYTCQSKPCEQPDCVYCTLLKYKACPHKNSTGCYTTAADACDCTPRMPGVANATCWLYGQAVDLDRYNGEACTKWSTGFYMGIKRPLSPDPTIPGSTCHKRCGNETLSFDDGEIDRASLKGRPPCQCDAACTRHMDCCLDYVDFCLPSEKQQPSCRGRCVPSNTSPPPRGPPPAVPIKGGGYCYCHSSCFNSFTDNNSFGSCCGDHDWQCNNALKDPVCFDARTQAQALHLFVAHHILENSTVTTEFVY